MSSLKLIAGIILIIAGIILLFFQSTLVLGIFSIILGIVLIIFRKGESEIEEREDIKTKSLNKRKAK